MHDLHSYIIPAVDDGAKDLATILSMLKLAEEQGTVGIVATSHVVEGEWLPAWEKITAECRALQQEAHHWAFCPYILVH